MGYLINAWNESQRKFSLNLKQIVNIAGDEYLESESAVNELREFFSMIDIATMERLCHECYSKDKKLKFDARGFAFQDLINEMGRRLGYQVEHGLYKGKRNEIGFDGLWKSYDGCFIVMESKATGDYAFSPETVIRYRDSLITERGIPRSKCSILVVYGRDEKSTLRNSVKGSDGASIIRLISANALFQLVKIATETHTGIITKQITTLLRPSDYFVLDNLVELVFPQTDDQIDTIEEAEEESKEEKTLEQGKMGRLDIPDLPDSTLKVGEFIKTAITNLASSGFEFSDEQMSLLCGEHSMHDVIGMQRNLPFFKIYDPDEKHGNWIDGRPRFYSKTITFGNYEVYLTKEIFKEDKEPFITWYNNLGEG